MIVGFIIKSGTANKKMLHMSLHGIFTELHGLRGFCPYPFFTPYPFLPLGKKGAFISHGWAWWPHGLTSSNPIFGPRP